MCIVQSINAELLENQQEGKCLMNIVGVSLKHLNIKSYPAEFVLLVVYLWLWGNERLVVVVLLQPAKCLNISFLEVYEVVALHDATIQQVVFFFLTFVCSWSQSASGEVYSTVCNQPDKRRRGSWIPFQFISKARWEFYNPTTQEIIRVREEGRNWQGC